MNSTILLLVTALGAINGDPEVVYPVVLLCGGSLVVAASWLINT